MALSDSRTGVLKPIAGLLVFGVIVLTATRVFSVYTSSSQLADYIRDKAVRVAPEGVSAAAIRADIVDHARGLGLPVSANQVSVTSDRGTLSIKLDYTVPVNLKLLTWNLHFTPSVLNRAY